MEIKGICNICGRASKVYTCSLCGNIVCRDCYDLVNRVCKPCKRYPGKTLK